MRTSVLVVREHGGAKDKLLCGTEVDFVAQKAEFKKLAASGKVHPKYEAATHYTSDGGMRRLKFISPEEAKAKAAAAEKLAAQRKAEEEKAKKAEAKKAEAKKPVEAEKAEAKKPVEAEKAEAKKPVEAEKPAPKQD